MEANVTDAGRRRAPKSGVRPKRTTGLFIRGRMDITFFGLVIILLTIGLVMLFSASYAYALAKYNDSYKFISKQFVCALLGLGVMYVFSRMNYQNWRKAPLLLLVVGVTVGSLILVLFLPGQAGVQRWVSIGPIQYQPSELAKFMVVILLAHLISANYKQMKTFKVGVLFMGGVLAALCLLVMLEKHMSATILIFCIGAVLLFVGGIRLKYLISAGVIAGVGIGAALMLGGFEYAKSRLDYWLDPWSSPTGKGYQTIQSLLSIGSGGLFGRGIGQSRQKYLWVPEPHNDFIFSIVCEELGLVGALIIIALFCMLIWRGIEIAKRAPDRFGSLLVVGFIFHVGIQALFNFMVVTNSFPNTGISLPFFSYGGTALIMVLGEMGIVLSVSRQSNMLKD